MFCSLLFFVVVHAGYDKQIHWCVTLCAVNCTVDGYSCCSCSTSHQSVANYSLRIAILPTPFALDIPIRGSLSEYCNNVWYRKTDMVRLPDGEKVLKIWLLVSTESTNMTWQESTSMTHRQLMLHDAVGCACIASHGKNWSTVCFSFWLCCRTKCSTASAGCICAISVVGVRLNVCLSHAGIVPKWLDILSEFLLF